MKTNEKAAAASPVGMLVVSMLLCCTCDASGDACSATLLVPEQEDVPGRVARLDAAAVNVCAVFEGGSVRCWGNNSDGQLLAENLDDLSTPIVIARLPPSRKVAIGLSHMCALAEGGCVWCWGESVRGQLGPDASLASRDPVRIPSLEKVVDIDASRFATAAAESDAGSVIWGTWNGPEGETKHAQKPVALGGTEPLRQDSSRAELRLRTAAGGICRVLGRQRRRAARRWTL